MVFTRKLAIALSLATWYGQDVFMSPGLRKTLGALMSTSMAEKRCPVTPMT